MAKIIKFALELKNGESARTIEDLRKHFDLEKIVAYFMNGRLLTWLKHRHLDDEAAALEKLSAEDAEFAKKLCDILKVSYDEHQKKADTIDANTLMADHERLNRLRQVTTDPEILAKIDRVAFDGKDLRRLAFDNETDIYLCSGRFVIPLNVQNKHYIGLGKVEAVIVSDEWVDFDEKGIQFTNVTFDDEYQRKVEALETPEKWAERGWKAYCEGNYAEAMKWNRKAAEVGNSEAMNRVGDMYYSGDGVSQDYAEAAKWFQKSANAGFNLGMNNLAHMYRYGKGVERNCETAIEWYLKLADRGDGEAMNQIGNMYYRGEGIAQNYAEAARWYQKSADAGFNWGVSNLGDMYNEGLGVEYSPRKALDLYQKSVEYGIIDDCLKIGKLYVMYDKDWRHCSPRECFDNAIIWYRKAADNGNAEAMYELAKCYWYKNDFGENKDKKMFREIARDWMKKAKEAGFEDAPRMLDYYESEEIRLRNLALEYGWKDY